MASSIKHHHVHAVEVPTRFGAKLVCPHCGKWLDDDDVYTDKKGWSFCRSCFRKGRGAIRIAPPEDKQASFLFELELPPDPDEFDLDSFAKEANRGLRAPAPRDPAPRDQRAWALTGRAASPFGDELAVPAFLLPALGAAGGAVLAGDDESPHRSRLRGALRGLLTGTGAELGRRLAASQTNGDLGAGLMGMAGGGALAYVLSRALSPSGH